jgi:acetyl esterase/lipase
VDFLQSDLSDFGVFSAEKQAIDEMIVAGNTSDITVNYFTPNGFLPEEQHTAMKLAQLQMDIYTPPATDTETARPLVIYLHTGNFLPAIFNGAALGDKKDSVAVNLCAQMAKRGYVVANVNYRTGWNPLSEEEDVRRGTLLAAVYRALQDTKTSVRFLRTQAASLGIDDTKILLFGQGSGGYVSQAYITLDEYSEIASLPKFINGTTGLPYVLEAVDGTLDGGPGAVRLSDPLQLAGISSEVHMAMSLGGALADISWLEAGEAPMVAMNCVRDAAAPFNEGTVIVGVTNEDVVDVHGPNIFIQVANDLGNNDAFANIPDGDVFTDRARSLYGTTVDYIYADEMTMTIASTPEGLFPVMRPIGSVIAANESDPWDWWDFPTLQATVAGYNAALGTTFDADVIHGGQVFSNPDMSQAQGLAYIDTVQGYLHPRVVLAMDISTGIGENLEVNAAMDLYPNPATNVLTISNQLARMTQVVVLNSLGQEVGRELINGNSITMDVKAYDAGMYIMTIIFEEGGQLSRKVILK